MTVFKTITTQRIQPTFDHESVTGPYLPNIDREGLVVSYIKSNAEYDKVRLKLYKKSLEKNIKKINL